LAKAAAGGGLSFSVLTPAPRLQVRHPDADAQVVVAAHTTACWPALQTRAQPLRRRVSPKVHWLGATHVSNLRSCAAPRAGHAAGGCARAARGRAGLRAHGQALRRCPTPCLPRPGTQARWAPAGGAGGPAGRAAGGRAGALPAGAVECGPRAAARPALHGRRAGPAPRARRRRRARPACRFARLQRHCARPSRCAPLNSWCRRLTLAESVCAG